MGQSNVVFCRKCKKKLIGGICYHALYQAMLRPEPAPFFATGAPSRIGKFGYIEPREG